VEAGNKPPQSLGNGAQRNPHSRPFFYVQPPSQPYYLYQHWGLNNPYSHYGVHGGYNLARPCMFPYQYMQYPGFVFPQTSLYPLDYRRIFEPRFHPPCGDPPRTHHQQQPQPHGRRETACSEAQTDPSDAITKLIECLDKIRATERQQSAARDRELDSGVASQSSGMFSPEEKKNEAQSGVLPQTPHESHLETPVVTYRDASAAAFESSPLVLNPERCWTAGLEEEPPLDSSSVHEDIPELERSIEEDIIQLDTEVVADVQSDIAVTKPSIPKCDAGRSAQSLSLTSSQPAPTETKSHDKVSNAEFMAASFDEVKSDCGYQILKLPLDSILTPGSAGAACIPPNAGPYYYNYLSMQTTHERMSVLSPSLDELSSRDEMFSTDLDDMDIFPKHVYTGRRQPEATDGPSRQATKGEETRQGWVPASKRSMCACCGKRLLKGTSRVKSHSSKMYRDDPGDSEDESRYGTGCEQPARTVMRKHTATRKPHSVPARHVTKPWYKRAQYKELTCQDKFVNSFADRHCTEDLTTSDQSRWADCDSLHRRQAGALQRQGDRKVRTFNVPGFQFPVIDQGFNFQNKVIHHI
uniref:Bucky ball n=1 Tax=Salarias fasciatus TaxID=181472 RepID=A0A672GX16_SALFA